MSEDAIPGAPLVGVLDDDSFQRTWFERLLERAGFRVRTYADPVEFLSRRAERPMPDALLLDIMMPEMDAFQVIQELEKDEVWCRLPIVLMTASPTKDRVLASHRLLLRPEGFLAKPIEVRSTLALLRSIAEAQDPAIKLRQLQRHHRSLELSVAHDLADLDDALAGSEENSRENARRMVEARRRAQELRLLESTGRTIGGTKEETAQKIKEAENEAEMCRKMAASADSARRRLLATRQDVAVRRRRMMDLETEIAQLSQALKPPPAPVRPVQMADEPYGGRASSVIRLLDPQAPPPPDPLDNRPAGPALMLHAYQPPEKKDGESAKPVRDPRLPLRDQAKAAEEPGAMDVTDPGNDAATAGEPPPKPKPKLMIQNDTRPRTVDLPPRPDAPGPAPDATGTDGREG